MLISSGPITSCIKVLRTKKLLANLSSFGCRCLSRAVMCDKKDDATDASKTLAPPVEVRGMKELDRDAFKKQISLPFIHAPVAKMTEVSKIAKPCFFKVPKFQPVQGEGQERRIFLHPDSINENLPQIEKLSRLLNLRDIPWEDVDLTYDNWTCDQIFRAVLPLDSTGNVAGFSIIGHIIHLNLKPDLMEYKYLIGQVLLDKYANIKTVVNKVQIIENEFRNLSMELLAGDPTYDVVVKENNCQYRFDFSKVFWNPRLGKEHSQICGMVNSYDTVFDVFAGVGPFAVPLAKKKCEVHANDLNPDSYHWLCHNSKLNKVTQWLNCYNLDGKVFIQSVVKKGLVEFWNKNEDNRQCHVVMNLPACALEFLEAFESLFEGENVGEVGEMPTVHCYFFKKKDEDLDEVMDRYFDAETRKVLEFFDVRLVAPNKMMMRVSYRIPKRVLFCDAASSERPAKKAKIT